MESPKRDKIDSSTNLQHTKRFLPMENRTRNEVELNVNEIKHKTKSSSLILSQRIEIADNYFTSFLVIMIEDQHEQLENIILTKHVRLWSMFVSKVKKKFSFFTNINENVEKWIINANLLRCLSRIYDRQKTMQLTLFK